MRFVLDLGPWFCRNQINACLSTYKAWNLLFNPQYCATATWRLVWTLLQILWIGLLVLCVEANILPSSSAEATAPAEAPNKEYRAVQPIGTPEALEFAEQTSSPADSPSMQAPASLSAQWPAATPINRFSNLTEAEIETLKQAFPGGVIPQDDGGVAQQMSTPNYDWKKPAACNNSIGVTADPDDPKCWYWCWSTIFFQPTGRGCRYCCWFDLCWNPPVFLFPLGYCAPCRSPPPPLSPR